MTFAAEEPEQILSQDARGRVLITPNGASRCWRSTTAAG
jgi:hypothetical protein